MTPTLAATAEPDARSGGWVRLRVLVIALCFLLNMLDGADLLVMSFVAPILSEEWNVSPESLGVIFSASLAGMAVGCLFVAPLADRYGRRKMILFALLLVALAMIGSGFVQTVGQLMLARFLIGIGVGTIGVSMTAMAAEYAPPRFSNLAVGFVQAGWPLGSILTALLVVKLMPVMGWQSVLIAIGILSVALFLIAFTLLPESMAFLAGRQPAGALTSLNGLRNRIGLAPLDRLPDMAEEGQRISVAALFESGRARSSVLLWTAVTFGYFVLYFVISWIPKLATQAGLPLDQAIFAGATYNAGAFLGTAAVGWIAVRYRLNRVIACFLASAAGAMLIFGGIAMPVMLTLLVAALVGVTVQGGFNGFWALAANLYPAEMRGTGIGWALGVGRVGAVLGPIAGGLLVGASVPISLIFAIYAVPLVIAALLCLQISVSKMSQ